MPALETEEMFMRAGSRLTTVEVNKMCTQQTNAEKTNTHTLDGNDSIHEMVRTRDKTRRDGCSTNRNYNRWISNSCSSPEMKNAIPHRKCRRSWRRENIFHGFILCSLFSLHSCFFFLSFYHSSWMMADRKQIKYWSIERSHREYIVGIYGSEAYEAQMYANNFIRITWWYTRNTQLHGHRRAQHNTYSIISKSIFK